MKILKYQKKKGNLYTLVTDEGKYDLYDDLIIKYELLLKKEITPLEFKKIIAENNALNAYYASLKALNAHLRTEKELTSILKKKGYQKKEIDYALNTLKKEGYLNHKIYIESYIHDNLNFNLIGEIKILNNLVKLGFKEEEVKPYLAKVDRQIYYDKINKYLIRKLKSNKKSELEFKKKAKNELINKGFKVEDINLYLEPITIEPDPEEIKKIVVRLASKYLKKYDLATTKLKIKANLYQKGYSNIDIDQYIN